MAGEMKAQMSQEFIQRLAGAVSGVDSTFPVQEFVDAVYADEWEELELKARIAQVATALGQSFRSEYPETIETLKKVCFDFDGLPALVFPEYVEQFGLSDWDVSMGALTHFTILCSSEFAVRPFIRKNEPTMLRQMQEWAEDNNHHIRRLASEGCRPRLPWSSPLKRFKIDPEPILPILERLKNDPKEYVRRSVANNLNDISKDHPELALELGRKWLGETPETDWVVKHGLRTLLKKGEREALLLFGYADPKGVLVKKVSLGNGEVRIGENEEVHYDLTFKGNRPEKFRLEYAVHYLKANGKLSRKVFQAGEKILAPGTHSLSKKHSFKQMTTRKHYPGQHALDVLVNGTVLASTQFNVLPE